MDEYEGWEVSPPLYLAHAKTTCWKCDAPMSVVALIAPTVEDHEECACSLSEVSAMPPDVLSFIQARFPSYKRVYSHTAGSTYYGNVCPSCETLSGDFYLQHEPDGPFFVFGGEDARKITLVEIPLSGPVEIDAGCGMGIADIILEGATREKVDTSSRNGHVGDDNGTTKGP